jgi:hypothetical protein
MRSSCGKLMVEHVASNGRARVRLHSPYGGDTVDLSPDDASRLGAELARIGARARPM